MEFEQWVSYDHCLKIWDSMNGSKLAVLYVKLTRPKTQWLEDQVVLQFVIANYMPHGTCSLKMAAGLPF